MDIKDISKKITINEAVKLFEILLKKNEYQVELTEIYNGLKHTFFTREQLSDKKHIWATAHLNPTLETKKYLEEKIFNKRMMGGDMEVDIHKLSSLIPTITPNAAPLQRGLYIINKLSEGESKENLLSFLGLKTITFDSSIHKISNFLRNDDDILDKCIKIKENSNLAWENEILLTTGNMKRWLSSVTEWEVDIGKLSEILKKNYILAENRLHHKRAIYILNRLSEGNSYEDVGKLIGLSRGRTHAITRDSISKIRHPRLRVKMQS